MNEESPHEKMLRRQLKQVRSLILKATKTLHTVEHVGSLFELEQTLLHQLDGAITKEQYRHVLELAREAGISVWGIGYIGGRWQIELSPNCVLVSLPFDGMTDSEIRDHLRSMWKTLVEKSRDWEVKP